MTKMTYCVALDKALEVVVDEEVRERLTALKASIEKRNASHSDKHYETREQKEAKALREQVLAYMEVGKAYSIAEVSKDFADSTNGKVRSALVRLAKDGQVVRSEDHRKVFYTKAQ